jgi:hypothetical protein
MNFWYKDNIFYIQFIIMTELLVYMNTHCIYNYICETDNDDIDYTIDEFVDNKINDFLPYHEYLHLHSRVNGNALRTEVIEKIISLKTILESVNYLNIDSISGRVNIENDTWIKVTIWKYDIEF